MAAGAGATTEVKAYDRCFHCRTVTTDAKLSRCARCQIARYCDANCQRGAWPTHKKCCRILTAITGTGSDLDASPTYSQAHKSMAVAAGKPLPATMLVQWNAHAHMPQKFDIPFSKLLDEFGVSNEEVRAVDLGCGIGSSTLAVAPRCSEILAVDASRVGITKLRGSADDATQAKLTTALVDLREFNFDCKPNLVIADRVLNYLTKDCAVTLLQKTHEALDPEGTFFALLFVKDGAKQSPVNSVYTALNCWFFPNIEAITSLLYEIGFADVQFSGTTSSGDTDSSVTIYPVAAKKKVANSG